MTPLHETTYNLLISSVSKVLHEKMPWRRKYDQRLGLEASPGACAEVRVYVVHARRVCVWCWCYRQVRQSVTAQTPLQKVATYFQLCNGQWTGMSGITIFWVVRIGSLTGTRHTVMHRVELNRWDRGCDISNYFHKTAISLKIWHERLRKKTPNYWTQSLHAGTDNKIN